MPRVKRGTVRRAKRKKLAKLTKGYFLTNSKLYRALKEAADRDRAAGRAHQLTYSHFIHGLKTLGIELDRKVLSDMAARDAASFAELVAKVKAAVPDKPQAEATPPAAAAE